MKPSLCVAASGSRLLAPVLLVLLAASSCSDDEASPATPPGQTGAPVLAEASAATKQVLGLTSGYASWAKFPENETLKQSPTHKNMYVISYYNQTMGDAIASKKLPMPDGAIIVKENWAKTTDAGPMALTIMNKQDAEWYWSQVSADGKVFVEDGKPLEGKNVTMCTNCHKTNDNDGILTHRIMEGAGMPVLRDASGDSKQVLAMSTGYKSWSKFAENQDLKPSAAHKNMLVVTYLNSTVGQAISGKTVPLPDGSLLVKENWAKATDPGPMALTVMHKQAGAWYWLQATPEGKVFVEEGKSLEGKDVAMCTNCHKTAINDGVLTHDFSK